jgi:anti-anti-sigma factor
MAKPSRARDRAAVDANVSFGERDGILVVRLSGSLAGEESAPLLDRVAARIDEAPGGVVLDLSGISYVGSFVIGRLLRLGHNCREAGRAMAVASAKDAVRRVVELLGLAAALGYYATTREAVAAVRAEGGGSRADRTG